MKEILHLTYFLTCVDLVLSHLKKKKDSKVFLKHFHGNYIQDCFLEAVLG